MTGTAAELLGALAARACAAHCLLQADDVADQLLYQLVADAQQQVKKVHQDVVDLNQLSLVDARGRVGRPGPCGVLPLGLGTRAPGTALVGIRGLETEHAVGKLPVGSPDRGHAGRGDVELGKAVVLDVCNLRRDVRKRLCDVVIVLAAREKGEGELRVGRPVRSVASDHGDRDHGVCGRRPDAAAVARELEDKARGRGRHAAQDVLEQRAQRAPPAVLEPVDAKDRYNLRHGLGLVLALLRHLVLALYLGRERGEGAVGVTAARHAVQDAHDLRQTGTRLGIRHVLLAQRAVVIVDRCAHVARVHVDAAQCPVVQVSALACLVVRSCHVGRVAPLALDLRRG
eukprot:Unigene9635_Nuclearia_a/m.29445 Unigene9635_Nuclearia_a/g.29445  ORF Unigene9635_Nuclearia_a/g.29445 Unigene9635_Nuclearia_a/m.29445 type:complete len:343 (+) Unigene9635_Nuclearia_a:644-1672(+)